MPNENNTSQKGKSGVLASARASVGALSLSGEPGQREKTWKLWKDRLVRATRWMAVNDNDKLDQMLLVGVEKFQNLLQTLPEQPTEYKSHIEMLDNTSSRIAITLTSGLTQNGYPTCTSLTSRRNAEREALHCDFPSLWAKQSSRWLYSIQQRRASEWNH